MYLKTVADTFGGVVNKSDIGNGFTEVSYGTGRTFIYRNISSAKSVNDMLVGEWFAIKTKDCLKEKYDDAIYEPVRNILDYSILSLTDSEKDTIRKSLKSAESCFSQSENTYLQKALGF